MSRTWQQNSDAINGLWPHCQWTDEEIDLWRSDLSGLDQDVLFEAIREVKRSRESLYPQLAWVHGAYRTLLSAKRSAERSCAMLQPAFSGERLEIDAAENARIRDEFDRQIEQASPADKSALDAIAAEIMYSLDHLEARTAVALLARVRAKAEPAVECDELLAGRLIEQPTSFPVSESVDIEHARQGVLRVLRENA